MNLEFAKRASPVTDRRWVVRFYVPHKVSHLQKAIYRNSPQKLIFRGIPPDILRKGNFKSTGFFVPLNVKNFSNISVFSKLIQKRLFWGIPKYGFSPKILKNRKVVLYFLWNIKLGHPAKINYWKFPFRKLKIR